MLAAAAAGWSFVTGWQVGRGTNYHEGSRV